MGREEFRSLRGMINTSINRMTNIIGKEFEKNLEELSEECPMWARFLSLIHDDFEANEVIYKYFIQPVRQALESTDKNSLEDRCKNVLISNTEFSVALLVLSDEDHEHSICSVSTINALVVTEILSTYQCNKELNKMLINWIMVSYPKLQSMGLVESFRLESVTDLIYLARMYVTNKILPKMYRNEDLNKYSSFEEVLKSTDCSLYTEQVDAFLKLFSEQCIIQSNLDEILGSPVSCDRIDKYRAYIRVAQHTLTSAMVMTKYFEEEDKLKDKVTLLETKLSGTERKLEKVRRNIDIERNKVKELEKKLKEKPKPNQALEDECKELKKSNAELLSKIAKLKSRIDSLSNVKQEEVTEEINETPICEEIQQEEPVEQLSFEQKLDFIKGYSIVIIGGPPNFSNKIRQFLPKARVIDKTTKYNEIKVGNADAVFIYSKIVGHSRVAKIESLIKDGRAKSYYVSSTNKELFCDEVYRLLSNE